LFQVGHSPGLESGGAWRPSVRYLLSQRIFFWSAEETRNYPSKPQKDACQITRATAEIAKMRFEVQRSTQPITCINHHIQQQDALFFVVRLCEIEIEILTVPYKRDNSNC
jgi:hypothetical protein